MNITDIKIRKLQEEGRMRAVVSVTFDDSLVVHDIKVIEGPGRYFLAMPSRKMPDGTYRDIVHPINAQVREMLEESILQLYRQELETRERETAAEDTEEPEDESL
ncbi:MAG: septation regulator SpoVG [Oscillospiraceae bacterium]|nr:septation regulator SpoVG [Oscillospiraceae bacterium]